MQINKDSWHYRFNLQWNNSDNFRCLRNGGSTTFCAYFRTTLISMVGCIMMFTLLFGACILLGLSAVSMVAFWLLPLIEFGFIDYGLGHAVSMFTPVALTLVGSISVLTGQMKVFPNWIKKPLKAVFEYEDESPCNKSLVKELYKAYKDKFCPIVTLKDD